MNSVTKIDEFVESRRYSLGGSDISAVFGLSPWKTPYQLWEEKTGRSNERTDTLQTRFGTFAETFVAQEYERRTGNTVERYTKMIKHPTAPIHAYIDRLVRDTGSKKASHMGRVRAKKGLECKTASAFAVNQTTTWGADGTDEVPEYYLLQCAVYMAITGCQYWDLAALFGNSEFRIYHLERDLELEEMIIDEAIKWWNAHVIQDVPPDPHSETEARQRWSASLPGSSVEADDAVVSLVRNLSVVKSSIATLEKEEQEIKDKLIPMLAESERLTQNGNTLLTYKNNKPSVKTDWKSLAEDAMNRLSDDERSSLMNAHTDTYAGARVLRLNYKGICS